MGIDDFKTYERIDGQTIAESEAEVSDSGRFALRLEDEETAGPAELHFQRLNQPYLSHRDEALIKTVYERAYESSLTISYDDAHAAVSLTRWKMSNGELGQPSELLERLLEAV